MLQNILWGEPSHQNKTKHQKNSGMNKGMYPLFSPVHLRFLPLFLTLSGANKFEQVGKDRLWDLGSSPLAMGSC